MSLLLNNTQFVIKGYMRFGVIKGGIILIKVSPSGLIIVNPHSIVVNCAKASILNTKAI